MLADFLLSCLDDNTDLSNQIFALKGLFLLLQNFSLDCPQYYIKLYALLLPQYFDRGEDRPKGVRSIFSMGIDHDSKARLLRLLDLSLRSQTHPSKLIAAYIKRIARLIVSHGVVQAPTDIMYLVGLIANLIKRHPRCMRLLHRKKTSMSLGLHLSIDPYKDSETDPLNSCALKSSLWELEIVMKTHYDQRVRDYCKLLKTDLGSRTNFVKTDDFIKTDPLAVLKQDIADIDLEKQAQVTAKVILAGLQ